MWPVWGFLAEQSPKPAGGHEATKVMMEMIVKGGFQTGGEPLLVLRSHQPDMCKDLPIPWSSECPFGTPLPMFGLSYLKGLKASDIFDDDSPLLQGQWG